MGNRCRNGGGIVNYLLPKMKRELSDLFVGRRPTIAALATRYDVSYVTMWRAVDALCREGLLETSRGRGLKLAGEERINADCFGQKLNSSAQRLASKIQEQIETGILRDSSPLPKNAALCELYHVSAGTATEALRFLAGKGFCRREGRQWLVGAKRPSIGGAIRGMRHSVLVVAPYAISRYHYLLHSEWTGSFLGEFFSVLEENGVRIVLVRPVPYLVPSAHYNEEGVVETAEGVDSLRNIVRQLGISLRGALCLLTLRDTAQLQEWLQLLVSDIKPVIWYNYRNDNILPEILEKGAKKPLFTAIRYERGAVESAVQTLYGMGHTKIAVPNLRGSDAQWVERRIALARSVANDIDSTIEIFESPRNMQFDQAGGRGLDSLACQAKAMMPPVFHNLAECIATSRLLPEKERINALICLPPIVSIIGKHPISAFLLPNDAQASLFNRCVRTLGLWAPKDFSALSFDNAADWKHLPISTVDFGMRRAGYCAAQIILKQTPVACDENRILRNACFIAHRDSLEPWKGTWLKKETILRRAKSLHPTSTIDSRHSA